LNNQSFGQPDDAQFESVLNLLQINSLRGTITMVYSLRDAVSAVVVASTLAFSPISVLAQSSDLIVEKKVFEAPSYKTVAGETG